MKRFLSVVFAVAIVMNTLLGINVLSFKVCEAVQDDNCVNDSSKVCKITLPADCGFKIETSKDLVNKKEELTFLRVIKNILYIAIVAYFSGVATQILNEKYPKFNEYAKKNAEFFKSLSQLTKDKFTGIKEKILLLKK